METRLHPEIFSLLCLIFFPNNPVNFLSHISHRTETNKKLVSTIKHTINKSTRINSFQFPLSHQKKETSALLNYPLIRKFSTLCTIQAPKNPSKDFHTLPNKITIILQLNSLLTKKKKKNLDKQSKTTKSHTQS